MSSAARADTETQDITVYSRMWIWRVGAVAAVAAVIFGVVASQYTSITGAAVGSTAVSRPAPCLPGQAVPILASPHVSAEAIRHAKYNSDPPTSGPHFGFTIAPGVYREQVSTGLTVHALEHGHIVIRYARATTRADVERLEAIARRYPRDVVLAPYDRMDRGIALTAWGRIDRLSRFDEPRIARFITELRGRYAHGWTRVDPC